MDELVRNLARARVERQAAEETLADLRAEFNGRPDVVAARLALESAEGWARNCDTVLRRQALNRWEQGQELHSAVKIVEGDQPWSIITVMIDADLTPWLEE